MISSRQNGWFNFPDRSFIRIWVRTEMIHLNVHLFKYRNKTYVVRDFFNYCKKMFIPLLWLKFENIRKTLDFSSDLNSTLTFEVAGGDTFFFLWRHPCRQWTFPLLQLLQCQVKKRMSRDILLKLKLNFVYNNFRDEKEDSNSRSNYPENFVQYRIMDFGFRLLVVIHTTNNHISICAGLI